MLLCLYIWTKKSQLFKSEFKPMKLLSRADKNVQHIFLLNRLLFWSFMKCNNNHHCYYFQNSQLLLQQPALPLCSGSRVFILPVSTCSACAQYPALWSFPSGNLLEHFPAPSCSHARMVGMCLFLT